MDALSLYWLRFASSSPPLSCSTHHKLTTPGVPGPWEVQLPPLPLPLSAAPFEWFLRLADVPGIEWTVPDGIVADPRLAAARPVAASPNQYAPLGIVWVDGNGVMLGDDYESHQSPAERACDGRWEIQDIGRAMRAVYEATALPGRRYDYHAALSWLGSMDGVPGEVAEVALRTDAELVIGNPIEALQDPCSLEEQPDYFWSQAARPILALIALYAQCASR